MYKLLIPFIFTLLLVSCGQDSSATSSQDNSEEDTTTIPPPQMKYGFILDSFNVKQGVIQEGWTLSHMLAPHGIAQVLINEIAHVAQDSAVNWKYVVPGKRFFVLASKNDSNDIRHIIYVKNKIEYVQIDFKREDFTIKVKRKPVETQEVWMSGEIVQNSNLTISINQQVKDPTITGELAESIAGIFAWSIDFFKLHPGDQYKVLYEKKIVDKEIVGIGEIKAIWFKHQGDPYYTFQYFADSTQKDKGYFDEKAKEMKRPFLMSPVKFSRVSSGYNLKRFHPVQKRVKAHLGTDYAAPTGTPILSTADGYVERAGYGSGNGNYVKVKHNETYSTQYLHMSKIAEGMRPGVKVKQGQF
ncbi:MAG: peptidoglycan DD-metalloendopeptidase family protein, partial [Crocinitomicaceae bacterium]|nr:peptidoglycan DD-metalloendopeptidase family protein [Crocinitomicaceae bacterium]